MKIGLIFGSFNPIHNGHIQIAEDAIKNGAVDIVWFVPAKQNPFKLPYKVSKEDRVYMLELVLEDPYYCCSIELDDKLNLLSNRTYDVLQYIKEYSISLDASFIIICGSDTYAEIPKWYRGEELLKEEFYVFDRDSNDISSSMIRERIKSGQDFREFVPEKVYNYIKERNLYVDTTEA